MTILEANAIRSAARSLVVPTFEETFPNAVKLPHKNIWYVPITMEGEDMPQYVKVEIGVPAWVTSGKVTAFDLEAAIAKDEADFAEKEQKKAENAAKREANADKPKERKVDNTAYDAKVLAYLGEHEEPITAADFFAAHEWDEENKETKGKLTSALTRLGKAGKVVNQKDKSKSYWTLAQSED